MLESAAAERSNKRCRSISPETTVSMKSARIDKSTISSLVTYLPVYKDFNYIGFNFSAKQKRNFCISNIFFDKPDSDKAQSTDSEATFVECKACKKKYKYNKTTRANLKQHIQKDHSVAYNYLKSKQEGKEFKIDNEIILPKSDVGPSNNKFNSLSDIRYI